MSRAGWRWRHLPVIVASVGIAALAWTVLALIFQRELSGFALLAGAWMASTLRYWQVPATNARPWLALLATALCIVLARWWIAAGFLGQSMGLYPHESVARMGAWFASWLNLKALGLSDYCLFVSGLLFSAWWARPHA